MNNFQYKISCLLIVFTLISCAQNESIKEVQGYENIPKSILLDGLDSEGILTLNKQNFTQILLILKNK